MSSAAPANGGIRLADLEEGTLPAGATVLQPIHIVPAGASTGVAQSAVAPSTGAAGGGSHSAVSVTGVSLTQHSLDEHHATSAGDLSHGPPLSNLVGSSRPRAKKKWTNRNVKLLVIGDSGLGKTTLVRCLLAVPGENMKLHDGSSTTFADFQRDPDSCLSTISWDNAEDCIHWTYSIQDTPGYGDDLNVENNILRVKKYLHECDTKWHRMESCANRAEKMTECVDPRVDLCIFALPPHRVRNIDMLFMHEISQCVPVLPVVTKADTMTIEECMTYRTEVNQKLKYPGLGKTTPVRVFNFSAETLHAVGVADHAMAQAMRPPYLVVCSNTFSQERMNQESPELWPERRYMWGTSEAFNEAHSDLLLLRRLLLEEGVEEICDNKTDRYEKWRASKMRKFRPLQSAAMLLLKTGLTAAVIATALQLTGVVDLRPVVENVKETVVDKAQETREVIEVKASNLAHGTADLVDRVIEPKVVVKVEKKKFLGLF